MRIAIDLAATAKELRDGLKKVWEEEAETKAKARKKKRGKRGKT